MSLRMATLGLLALQPGSGYDLLKRFEKTMAHVWPATQSQLYGELNKLADTQLIEVTAVGPRGRKVYDVTAEGRVELLRWITEPESEPPYRSAVLLRVFLLSEIPPEQARVYLESLAEEADADLKHFGQMRDSIPWDDSDEDFYGRVALEFGLRFAQMRGEWARWAQQLAEARRPLP